MKAKLLLGFGLLGLLATGCGSSVNSSGQAVAAAPADSAVAAAESDCGRELADVFTELLDLTNAERRAEGLADLRFSYQLGKAAQAHAQDMAVNDYFSHTRLNGDDLGVRLSEAGYRFEVAGENIAAGFFSAQAVSDAWMNSPGHRANILNPSYREVGFGLFYDPESTYESYWAQNFGTPRQGSSNSALFLPSTCSIGTVASADAAPVQGIGVAAVRPVDEPAQGPIAATMGATDEPTQGISVAALQAEGSSVQNPAQPRNSQPVPEPAFLLGFGMCLLGGNRLRRQPDRHQDSPRV